MTDKGVSLNGLGTKGPYKVDKATTNMSLKHMTDTLEYNLRHAEEHLTKARETCAALEKAGHDEKPPVSKQLLDNFDYFEKAVNHQDDLDTKVKKASKMAYKPRESY